MSAQIIDSTIPASTKLWPVSFKWLLGLYAIIPVCLSLQLADGWLWQGYLKANLPSSPTHFLLFQILFGTPHIIASAIVLASNREYIQRYRRPVLLMTAAIAVVFGLGSLFIPYKVFYIAVAALTVLHVLKQQHGVARGVCRLPDWAFQLMLWLSVAAGLAIYIGIFLNKSLDAVQAEWLKSIAGGLCVSLVFTAFYCQRYATSAFGKWFLWANVLLVVTSFYFYAQKYYFLAILGPRLVHDITAYSFYVTHDYNKHHAQPQNTLFRYAAYCKVPIIVVLPLLSFALTFVLQAYGDQAVSFITRHLFAVEIRKVVTLGLLGYLALLHYYTEAFTWKQDSPYRRFIAFSK